MKVLLKQGSCQYLISNKQNIKMNRKAQISIRHRNDHSIQTKSPIKIPQQNMKRQDLTFRQRTCNSPSKHEEEEQSYKFRQNDANTQNQCIAQHESNQQKEDEEKFTYTMTSLKLPKDNKNLHLNLGNLGNLENDLASRLRISLSNQKDRCCWGQASQVEGQIIDSMWDLCNKLAYIDNCYLRESVDKIRTQIAKMLAIVAHQNFNSEVPLASSKKTKLQNCIAISHCEKETHHKEIESYHQQAILTGSKRTEQPLKSSKRSIKSEQIQEDSVRFQQSEQTPKLQMRKIMYMLEGKQKIQSSSCSGAGVGLGFNSAKNSCERLSQLSSFNQNQQDQSGFTVFQIQRGSERLKSSTRDGERFRKSDTRRQSQSRVSKISQDFSEKSENMSLSKNNVQQPVCIGTKRKVLNDIVAMLNQKYNKNIKLQ